MTGAAVEILDGATPVATGSTLSGYTYTTEKIKYGTYFVTVKKDGYKDFTQQVVLNGDDVKVDAQLESVNEVKAELKDAYKSNETQVQVNFTNKIAVPTKDNFSIEGLTITDVKITDDQKSVILTVSGMELDKTYTVKTNNILDANGKSVANGAVDFTARKITYQAKMDIVDVKTGESITQIKSDGKETAKFVVTLLDDAGNVIKDDAEIRFTTTAGNFAETKVSAQSGVATNIFTSEISATPKDALVTATVVESKNKDLINKEAKRTLSMSPVIDTDNKSVSLTDVMVETCDRVILYFNKDVNVTDYTKNTTDEKYSYDSKKMEILIGDNVGKGESVYDGRPLTPMALAPVEGNSKALYAILPEGDYLTDNAKTIVRITDKTKSVPTTETKSTFVTDIRTPSMLSVTNNGLKEIKIKFSEPVQNYTNDAAKERTYSAEDPSKWVIDNIKLSDARYGKNEKAKATVGTFNVKTGEDNRNVVTIALGKDNYNKQIYFKAGSHSVQGNKIGDWANITDRENNLINTQTLDFVIEADNTAPTANVTVESPEQFDLKFNTLVDLDDLKNNLELQQKKDNEWVKVTNSKGANSISIRPVPNTDGKEYIVELTEDWTKILDTKNTKKNYYNFNFRLYMKKDVIENVLNGLKNAEITLDLNDKIMKEPDVTSTEMKKVEIKDNAVFIDMSEPVQIALKNEDGTLNRTLTPKDEQGEKLSDPIVQFISSGDKETIQGHIVDISAHDNQIKVVPDSTISTGTWKVVVRNVSDDVGNTSPTLVEPNFVVDKPIVNDDFNVLWVVAVKAGNATPVGEVDYDNDVIYVKFNKEIKTYGGTLNAGATTNYTVNGYSVPSTSKINSTVAGYNDNAVTKNGYSDIVAIQLKPGTLTSDANTINISKTLESATGDKLGNGGLIPLSRDYAYSDEVFTWNYGTCDLGVIYKAVNKYIVTASELQKFLDDGQYKNYDLTGVGITDENKATLTLKHTASVDFGGKKVKELIINTQETGKLNISGIDADKITVNAPNADVILDGVHVKKDDKKGTIEVQDILDGTLTLNNTTADVLKITDSNAGAVELKGTQTAISESFEIDTTGTITLIVASDVTVNDALPGTGSGTVDVKKACTLHVKNATSNPVTVKLDASVNGDDVTITENKSGAVTATGGKDGKAPVVKPEVEKTVTLSKIDSTPGKAAVEAVTASGAAVVVKVDGSAKEAGKISVRVGSLPVEEIDVAKGDVASNVVTALKKAAFTAYYGVSNEGDFITFTDKTEGAGRQFNVTIDPKDTGLTVKKIASADGATKVDAANASYGKAEFTVTDGGNVAGTLKITINSEEISVDVDAYETANSIAGKIATEIGKNTKLKDIVDTTGSSNGTDTNKVVITRKDKSGVGSDVTVSYKFTKTTK